ncbi:MAG: hypothetical protein R2883_06405 [Caldisericia bacterium]
MSHMFCNVADSFDIVGSDKKLTCETVFSIICRTDSGTKLIQYKLLNNKKINEKIDFMIQKIFEKDLEYSKIICFYDFKQIYDINFPKLVLQNESMDELVRIDSSGEIVDRISLDLPTVFQDGVNLDNNNLYGFDGKYILIYSILYDELKLHRKFRVNKKYSLENFKWHNYGSVFYDYDTNDCKSLQIENDLYLFDDSLIYEYRKNIDIESNLNNVFSTRKNGGLYYTPCCGRAIEHLLKGKFDLHAFPMFRTDITTILVSTLSQRRPQMVISYY